MAASGGTAPYAYTVTAGALPAGMTIDPATGAISGAPDTAGAYDFTVTATDTNSASGSASYSLSIALPAPVANDGTATVAANSTGNAITLGLSGGSTVSVAVSSAPGHGTATASGTTITYTPAAGYSGSDSFTYTASNATGTSAAATVTITVTPPTLALTPEAGALPAGTVGTAYSQTAVASGGTAPYSYAVTAGTLPVGLTLDGTTGAISGTPTEHGDFNFTVTATDAYGATGVAAYSLAVGDMAPVANNGTATVAANSSANPIALSLGGGTATSVAIASAPAHGSATASGTTITYAPMAGYSGPDSFTYTASNATGSSAAATVTITVEPPTLALSPAAGGLPAGAVGTAYSQPVSASGGTAPYSYAVTAGSFPAGLSLDTTTGVIAGAPTTAGNYSFTVTASEAYAATGSVSYSVAVSAPPTVFAFAPSSGALAEAMAGEDYTQQISASGGSGALIYSLASRTLPRGLVLNISTGELTGPLAADAEGEYSFTIEVRDGNGATGTASFTLKVNPRAVTVTDKVVDVPAGATPNNVYLNGGATGGPFTSADLTFVEPANAGTATITRGQLAQADPVVTPTGWYLEFEPNPAYSGQVRVGFRLTSALGVSNTGTVIYNLGYSAADVAQEIDSQVQGFVQRRQSMISSAIEVPVLLERRRMASANNPVTTRMSPSADGLALGFASSLAQMKAARNSVDGATNAGSSLFNIWVDGALLAHHNEENGGKWGSFAMVSLGADYLLSERALLGLSFHSDRMVDPTDEDATLTGNGWLTGPYASFEIGKNLFWDTSLLYGGSSNDIETHFWGGSFDTRRWLFDSSLEGQWQLDDITVLTPRLRAVYLSEEAKDYAVRNAAGDLIELDGFTQEQLRVSLGAEIARTFELENGTLVTPKFGVNGGFSGLDGSGAFGSFSTGMSLQTVNDWTIDAGLLFNIEGEGEKSIGAKVGMRTRF
nr:putative Ig domain-containing protein [Aliihoeflea sp. 40Bstr573]